MQLPVLHSTGVGVAIGESFMYGVGVSPIGVPSCASAPRDKSVAHTIATHTRSRLTAEWTCGVRNKGAHSEDTPSQAGDCDMTASALNLVKYVDHAHPCRSRESTDLGSGSVVRRLIPSESFLNIPITRSVESLNFFSGISALNILKKQITTHTLLRPQEAKANSALIPMA